MQVAFYSHLRKCQTLAVMQKQHSMTISEKFKVWLETIYVSNKTGKPLTSAIQYVTGLNALNKKLNLPGEGIYDPNADLKRIKTLIHQPENFQKDYSSHFNAFLKFKNFSVEQNDRNIEPLQRQTDVFKKQKVEIAAIEKVIKYFESSDYIVISTEKDNVGWDLEATNMTGKLFLEVKGLSFNILSIELSPNEYKKSKEHPNYKLCIVRNALSNPELCIFQYDSTNHTWKSDTGIVLGIQERIAARVFQF